MFPRNDNKMKWVGEKINIYTQNGHKVQLLALFFIQLTGMENR